MKYEKGLGTGTSNINNALFLFNSSLSPSLRINPHPENTETLKRKQCLASNTRDEDKVKFIVNFLYEDYPAPVLGQNVLYVSLIFCPTG